MFLGEPTEDETVPGSSGGPDPKAILGECCKTTVTIEECHEFKSDVGMFVCRQQEAVQCFTHIRRFYFIGMFTMVV